MAVVDPVLHPVRLFDSRNEYAAPIGEAFRPTNALPGTREKLEILASRLRDGLPLWHPEDPHAEDPMLQGLLMNREFEAS